jgi:hypothetical protein
MCVNLTLVYFVPLKWLSESSLFIALPATVSVIVVDSVKSALGRVKKDTYYMQPPHKDECTENKVCYWQSRSNFDAVLTRFSDRVS